MAKQTGTETHVYTIPLRKDWVIQSRNYRAPRAIRTIRGYVSRHLKIEDVRLSEKLNQEVTRHITKPPAKLKVAVTITEGVARVRLADEPEPKKEEKKGAAGALREKLGRKKTEAPAPANEPVKAAEPKKPAAEAAKPAPASNA